jgi:hypothetical protein
MPKAILTCVQCGVEFVGRPNRLHCSVGCRRQREMRRRQWEEAARRVRWLERNATAPELHRTKKQAAHWMAQADAARAKLPPRP